MIDSANTIVRAASLVKTYEMGDVQVQALKGVDLEIHKGEMVAIMGPSGSGKSTLMHLIGCLDTPTEGKVFIEEHDVSEMDDGELAAIRNKKIGFIFQQFNLLSKISILDNVATPLLYARVPLARRRQMALEALDRVGLGDRVKHKPNELSGGQKQRAAIARALVTEPALILADEPTGALDTKTGAQIMDFFRELIGQGHTIAVVTHDQEIGRLCDRIIHIRDGLIETGKEKKKK